MESLIPLLVAVGVVAAGVWMIQRRRKNRSETTIPSEQPAGEKVSGKTKQCSECKAEIPKGAKKCMHCGSKDKRLGLGGLLVGGLFALLIYSWVSLSVDKDLNPPLPLTAEQKADRAKQAKLNSDESDAYELCMKSVQFSAKFPSSVDFSTWDSPGTQPMNGGGWIVRLAFESKNGLGMMIPSMARCEVKDGKLQYFKVSNR